MQEAPYQLKLDEEFGRKLAKGYFPIMLQFPVDPKPRYGYGKPAHPQLSPMMERERGAFRERYSSFLRFKDEFRRIPLRQQNDPHEPSWLTGPWLGGFDSVALYGLLTELNPALYLEVGSGLSTKFARRAINDQKLRTQILSIDPEPRAEIDELCDGVVRQRLEDVDLKVFDLLQPGDILFIDSSHVCLMNSDVSVFFMDVLPRLKPGVIVEVHDIYLPYDYPLDVKVCGFEQSYYRERWYTEQYLLGTHLLAMGDRAKIVLANEFASRDPELKESLNPLWDMPELRGVLTAKMARGSSLWFEVGAR